MTLARDLFGEPEHGVCRHCDEAVTRWPNRPREFASPFDTRWIHNPHKGFRMFRCRGRATVAEVAQ